jgi:serine/threonine-protein kinase
MTRTFAITTTATENLKADAKGHAEAVFTVTNTSARPVRGLAKAKALDSTEQDWLKLAGESERDFAPGTTQQFIIRFEGPVTTAPPGAAPKGAEALPGSGAQPGAAAAVVAPAPAKYPFRLDVASAANPDEDFIEGPVVTVEMLPAVIKPPFKWWIIPIVLVVLIGIGVGLWLLLRNGKVQVPDVVGMQFAEAEAAIKGAKLVAVQKEVQLTEAPEGQVLDQDPKPGGEKVKEGTEINLIVEGAEPLVVVPDVVKLAADVAKQRITEAGLTAVESGTEFADDGFGLNQVKSQKPAAGAEVEPGATVELLVVSQKLFKVPDVTFKPLEQATQIIKSEGLQVVQKEPELAEANVAPGHVKRQTPAGGTKVPPNSIVELVTAAVTAQVPRLAGKKIADAQLLLQQNGLSLGTVWGTYNESNASTVLITGQTPAAGTQVARGSNVNVTVRCLTLGCRIFRLEGAETIRPLPTKIQPLEPRRQEPE